MWTHIYRKMDFSIKSDLNIKLYCYLILTPILVNDIINQVRTTPHGSDIIND